MGKNEGDKSKDLGLYSIGDKDTREFVDVGLGAYDEYLASGAGSALERAKKALIDATLSASEASDGGTRSQLDVACVWRLYGRVQALDVDMSRLDAERLYHNLTTPVDHYTTYLKDSAATNKKGLERHKIILTDLKETLAIQCKITYQHGLVNLFDVVSRKLQTQLPLTLTDPLDVKYQCDLLYFQWAQLTQPLALDAVLTDLNEGELTEYKNRLSDYCQVALETECGPLLVLLIDKLQACLPGELINLQDVQRQYQIMNYRYHIAFARMDLGGAQQVIAECRTLISTPDLGKAHEMEQLKHEAIVNFGVIIQSMSNFRSPDQVVKSKFMDLVNKNDVRLEDLLQHYKLSYQHSPSSETKRNLFEVLLLMYQVQLHCNKYLLGTEDSSWKVTTDIISRVREAVFANDSQALEELRECLALKTKEFIATTTGLLGYALFATTNNEDAAVLNYHRQIFSLLSSLGSEADSESSSDNSSSSNSDESTSQSGVLSNHSITIAHSGTDDNNAEALNDNSSGR